MSKRTWMFVHPLGWSESSWKLYVDKSCHDLIWLKRDGMCQGSLNMTTQTRELKIKPTPDDVWVKQTNFRFSLGSLRRET